MSEPEYITSDPLRDEDIAAARENAGRSIPWDQGSEAREALKRAQAKAPSNAVGEPITFPGAPDLGPPVLVWFEQQIQSVTHEMGALEFNHRQAMEARRKRLDYLVRERDELQRGRAQ